MNLKQAAARLGVHYQTAYRWVRSGDLAAVRVGARYEVSDAAIHQFVATRQSVLRQADPQPGAPTATRTIPTRCSQDLEAMAGDAADQHSRAHCRTPRAADARRSATSASSP